MPSDWALKQRAIQPRNRIAVDGDDKPIVRDLSMRPIRLRALERVQSRHGIKRKVRRTFG